MGGVSGEGKSMSLTYSQRERINLDVLMGVLPPANEPLEAAECRRLATAEVAEARAKGWQVAFPTDWDADEEGTVEAGEPGGGGGGGIPCGDSFISPDKECRLGDGGPAGRENGNANLPDGKLVDFDKVHEFLATKVGQYGMTISIGPKLNDGLRAFAVIDAGSHPALQAGSDGFVNEETWKTWQTQTAPPPPVPEGHHPSGLKKLTYVDNSKWTATAGGAKVTAIIAAYEHAAAKGDNVWLASNAPKAMSKPLASLNTWDKKTVFAYKKAVAEVEKLAAEQAKPRPDDIISVANWTKTGGSLGTNPGGTYTDDSGKKWYVKQGYTDAHAKNEVLAAKLYEAAGIAVMPQQLVKFSDGKLGIAHPWTDDLKPFDVKDAGQHGAAKKGFAAHAWLANWDAVGAHPQNGVVNHNLAVIGGYVTGVETGGAMQYGGLGASKPFGTHVTEWAGLRDPKVNPSMAKVFGAMSDSELAASAAHVVAVPDSVVRELVKKFGPADKAENDKLADTILVRKGAIKSEGENHNQQANLANVSAPPKPPGDSTGKAVFPPPPTPPNEQGFNLSQNTIKAIQKAMATGHPENVAAVDLPPWHNQGSFLSKVHEWHKQVLAVMQVDQMLAVATGAGNAGQAPTAPALKPSALAAPPVITNVSHSTTYQPKFDAIHNAASTMSPADATAAILAVKSSADAKGHWPKKLHAYKLTALAAVGGTLPVSAAVNLPPKPAPVAPPAPKPVFDPANLPPPPAYTASSKAHVNEANTLTMKALWEAAKSGEKNNLLGQKFEQLDKATGKTTGNLKPFSEHPAAPVRDYYNALVTNIDKQLNPPPPPPPAVHAAFKPHIAEQFGVDITTFNGKESDAGRWVILDNKAQPTYTPGSIFTEKWHDDDIFLESPPGHKGVFQPLDQTELNKHYAATTHLPVTQQNALSSYKGSKYDSINTSLASGKPTLDAINAAKGVFNGAVPIPEGKWLSRNFSLKGKSTDEMLKIFQATEGHIVQDPVLGSTSTAKDIFSNTVKLYMHVGPGLKGLRGVNGESEIILPPNTRMAIDKVRKVGSHVFIFALLLPTLPTQCCGNLKN